MTSRKLQLKNNKGIYELSLFALVFIAAYIAYGIYVRCLNVDLESSYPTGWFTFYPEDRFKDFFTINYAVKDWDPYTEWLSNYPPLILLIARIVSNASEYRIYDLTTLQNAINDPQIMGTLIAFVAAFIVLGIAIIVIYSVRENFNKVYGTAAGIAVSVMMMVSAPVVFAIDRGNYILVSYILLLLWAVFEEREETQNLAAVFIGLCAAVKIYPLFIICFFVLERKWKKVFIACVTGGITTVLPFLTFKGTLMGNISGFGGGLLGFGGGNYMPYFNVGLTGFASYILRWVTGTVQDAGTVKYIWLGVGGILAIACMLLLLKEKRTWLRVLILTSLMIFLTPNSYIYNSAYLMAPLAVMLLGNREKIGEITKKDLVYFVIAALLMVPKAYGFPACVDVGEEDLSQVMVGINVFLDGLLYSLMFIYFIVTEVTRIRIGKSSHPKLQVQK